MDGDTLLAVNSRAMVGDHGEDRVGPERFFFGGVKESAEAVIGIFYGILAPLFVGIFGDSAFGVSVRFAIGDGEDGGEERFAGLAHRPQFFDGAVEDIFIAYAPSGGEGGFWIISMERRVVFDEAIVAVAHREGFHVVEHAAAAVSEKGRVTVAFE